ncbi:hypothetical protein M0R45_022475 [Rubus argutus]|uniref:Purple acid phosphatase n=1 Tax=Rubus argutus TaxID=59490 RepID=A0AAW1XI24_RUBAR
MQLFSFRRQFMILITGCLSLICLVAKAEFQRFQQQTNEPGSLSFFVVGDWGRRGLYNQSQVANQMGLIADKANIDIVFSTGDNFYDDGLKGVDDPAFNESFSNIYSAQSLQKPYWFSVLGNHDYHGDVLAQLSPALRQIDSRWFCSRSFRISADFVEVFSVDTTPFVDDYFTNPKEHVYDWRGVLPRKDYLSKLLKDLDYALKYSSAKWKIVVGHHTIRSAGHHGNTTDLVTHLLPILKANRIDFYINGHDHCLEHISDADSKIEFFTSGGGSKAWRGDIKWWDPKELKLYYDGQGFMSVKITKSTADIKFYDVFGNVLHRWSKSKELIDSVTHKNTYT